MQNKETKPWFPVWIDKWLFGSTRIELKPDERAVFFDLVVLSKKDDGHIRANAGIPYLPTQLAGMLVVEIELLERTITRCIEVGKITRNQDGTLFVTSHPAYDLSGRQRRRIDAELEEADDAGEFFSRTQVKCPKIFSGMATSGGKVRFNRLVAACAIGRELKPEEEVHHKNKKETDNRPSNLMLFANHDDHAKFEWGEKVVPVWDGAESDETAIMAEITAVLYIEDIKIKKIVDKEKKAAPITYIHEMTEFQGIEKKDLEIWAAAYPAADIKSQIAKMIAWIEGDWPRRRKAKWRLFIQKWLARTQESGGTRAGSAPESKYVGSQPAKAKTVSEVKYQEARERERRRLERLYGRDQDKINTGLAEFSHNYWGDK